MNMLPDHCVEFLMSTLKSILLVDKNEFASKDHLQILVIILCRIALDSTLQMSAAVIEIQLLIIEILDKFSEDLWPQVSATLYHISLH